MALVYMPQRHPIGGDSYCCGDHALFLLTRKVSRSTQGRTWKGECDSSIINFEHFRVGFLGSFEKFFYDLIYWIGMSNRAHVPKALKLHDLDSWQYARQ